MGGKEPAMEGQTGWVDLLAPWGRRTWRMNSWTLWKGVEALDALDDGPLTENLEKDFNGVSEVFNRIQELSNLLKGPFLSTLNLQIPESAATDND